MRYEESPFSGWTRLRKQDASMHDDNLVKAFKEEGIFVSPLLQHPEFGPAVVTEPIIHVTFPFRDWQRHFAAIDEILGSISGVRVLTSPLGTDAESFDYFRDALDPMPVYPPLHSYDEWSAPRGFQAPVNEDGFVAFSISVSARSGFEVLRMVEKLAPFEWIFGATPSMLTRVKSYMPAPFPWAPNDPGIPASWHLDELDVGAAWTRTYGYSSVRVGVMDGGVQFNHPDLSLIGPGRNFADDQAPENFGPGITIDQHGMPVSYDNHGTAVVGVLRMLANNNEGSVGIAPNVQVVPLRFSKNHNEQGSSVSDPAWRVAALNYAAGVGCRVVNMSFGVPFTAEFHVTLANLRSTKNMVFFAASGNAGNSSLSYPSSDVSVVAVGAVDENLVRSGFSNYGLGLKIVAPGESILTTDRTPPNGYFANSSYVFDEGTSYSSPLAAGLAALIISKNPRLTSDQVESAIFNTALSLPVGNPNTSEYGHGLIRPAAALDAVPEGLWIRANTVDMGDTWKYHPRFKYFSDPHFPIFYHIHHGWQSAGTDDPDSFWFFDMGLQKWWFTDFDSAVYPMMSLEGTKWYYYDEGSTNPRMFYDFVIQQWVPENNL